MQGGRLKYRMGTELTGSGILIPFWGLPKGMVSSTPNPSPPPDDQSASNSANGGLNFACLQARGPREASQSSGDEAFPLHSPLRQAFEGINSSQIQKRKMRLPTLPLEPALHRCNMVDKIKLMSNHQYCRRYHLLSLLTLLDETASDN